MLLPIHLANTFGVGPSKVSMMVAIVTLSAGDGTNPALQLQPHIVTDPPLQLPSCGNCMLNSERTGWWWWWRSGVLRSGRAAPPVRVGALHDRTVECRVPAT